MNDIFDVILNKTKLDCSFYRTRFNMLILDKLLFYILCTNSQFKRRVMSSLTSDIGSYVEHIHFVEADVNHKKFYASCCKIR